MVVFTLTRDLIHLARPTQYTKNLFIFLPMLFAFKINDLVLLKSAFIAFIAFSLIASAVYTVNDWFDRLEDASHSIKKARPIASGRIGLYTAVCFASVLFVSGIYIGSTVSAVVVMLLLIYMCLNIAYSVILKHIAIIDVVVISLGFVIRLFVGSYATNIGLSHWIIVMTFLLALFLSLAKRRDDVLIYLKTQTKARKVIDGYNLKFLDAAMMMTSSIVILAYILWSISQDVTTRIGSDELYLTSIFVVVGILRYMQITFVEEKSGNPSSILLIDRFIQLSLFGWITSFALLFYV